MAADKCAHPICNCTVAPHNEYGKYCSDHCKKAHGMTELHCACPHPECRTK